MYQWHLPHIPFQAGDQYLAGLAELQAGAESLVEDQYFVQLSQRNSVRKVLVLEGLTSRWMWS